MKPEDKYGMLTPIRPTSERYNNEVVWEFCCEEAYQNKRKEILEQLIISKRQTVKKWVELNLPIFYFAIIFVKKIERSVDYKR